VRKQKKQTTRKRKSKLGRYKSSLEKTTADLLSDAGIKFTYEEDEFVIQDPFRYEAPYFKMTPKGKDLRDRTNSVVLPIKYTPDFCAPDLSWVIEVKGYLPSHHDFPMRWKIFMKHMIETCEGEPPALFLVKNRQQVEKAIEVIKNLE
jgi:hypothetical protein